MRKGWMERERNTYHTTIESSQKEDYKEEQSESSQEEEAFGKDNRYQVAKGGSCQEWKGDEFIQPP